MAERPKLKNKELDALIAAAWEQGWWCEIGKKKHIKCFSPDLKSLVVVPSTPSDHRSVPNARSKLRQAGLDV